MSELVGATAESIDPAVCPFDHHAPRTAQQVWDTYADLRSRDTARSDLYGGFYVLTRFAEVRAAARDHATFSSAGGHRIPAIGTGRSLPIDVDPPRHAEYRRLFTDRVTPASVAELEPFLRRLIGGLVREFHKAGGGDFVPDVALAMPLAVLTEVVGFSEETVSNLRRLTEQSWTRVTDASLDEARRELREVVQSEIARHRSERPSDYLTTMLSAEVDGRAIEDDELERILLTFAIAGHETTANAAAWLVHFIASDDTLQLALRNDPTLIPAYVEESLRLGTPAQAFARETTGQVEVGACPIPAGERVLLAYGAANRDERQYDRPEQFDVVRGSRGHLAFGFGIHQCPGALLARTELRLMLDALLSVPPIRSDGPPQFDGLMGGIHLGPRALPIRFDSAEVTP
ncbi:cytochrome P450 [Antrihabitans sp. YC2-6]|uniref:cytochrome P450 n=1 Tax=Antrihabitans sp. YC2-6 TaxID=2799498 RepID=UPI0018F3AE49|nr:cytochrome P450 [Antrihabitans sp. YC2-6]MBJ8348263.1 cytochrome P450 [Antrihabitans sp. YC2-6]